MQLTIENVKTNPSGKSLAVTAGGKNYLAKTGCGLQAGMTIDAELKESFFNGKSNIWIEQYKRVNGSAAPQAPAATGGGSEANARQPAGAAPVWLPFASNTVAHAINAGIITAPNHIEAWTRAVKEAFQKVIAE